MDWDGWVYDLASCGSWCFLRASLMDFSSCFYFISSFSHTELDWIEFGKAYCLTSSFTPAQTHKFLFACI